MTFLLPEVLFPQLIICPASSSSLRFCSHVTLSERPALITLSQTSGPFIFHNISTTDRIFFYICLLSVLPTLKYTL